MLMLFKFLLLLLLLFVAFITPKVWLSDTVTVGGIASSIEHVILASSLKRTHMLILVSMCGSPLIEIRLPKMFIKYDIA